MTRTIERVEATVLLGLLVLGVVVLTPVAHRIGVPQPVLLTIFGLVLGLAPLVPAPDLPSDLILPVVLPPLLFAATQTTSVPELRRAARPILGLAVGLTVVTGLRWWQWPDTPSCFPGQWPWSWAVSSHRPTR